MTPAAIEKLVQPYFQATSPPESRNVLLFQQLNAYLDLIMKWNARTNLTAIRIPEEIVLRHFGESLFTAAHLGSCNTLLDFGSGAGFPGIPIQLFRPDIKVTLGESQNKKTAFLREVCRELHLSTEIFPARIEAMPQHRQFDVVAMRAVDQMNSAIVEATRRASDQIVLLTTSNAAIPLELSIVFNLSKQIQLPQSKGGILQFFNRR